MGGAAVALLAPTRRRSIPLATLLSRAARGPRRRRRGRGGGGAVAAAFLDRTSLIPGTHPRAPRRGRLPREVPEHMDEEKILSAISLEKDVDGFRPLNVGNLALRSRKPLFVSCAAKACLELLLQSGIELMGKHVTMIGRSKVVGLPTSLLLQRHHATMSVIHAFTTSPEEITRESDIVISAAGVANLVRGSWLKQGAVVIDVGTNPIEDPTSDYGYRLTGDICFEEAVRVASAITPLPGGVGPVTISMLLANTLDSAKRVYGLSD